MTDFIPQFTPVVRSKDIEAVRQQMLSGWVGPSAKTMEFEEEIRLRTGARHCISTTSGTTAIFLAIKSLGLPEGSTILFPSYTFLAGANACRMAGYKIQLVDVDSHTMCMKPVLVRKALICGGISCVMFVNHNAYVGEDVLIIRKICNEHNVPMLEDSSQAIGMPRAGMTGNVGIFSFSVPKLITTGQGGAIITNDNDIAGNCMNLRDHGGDWRKSKIHERIGGNFKFNDILAAYGLSQLKDIETILGERKRVFDEYRSQHISMIDYGYDSTWMVLYLSDFADDVIEALKRGNIQAMKYYRPINHNPPYRTSVWYGAAEFLYEEIVYLPSSLSLSSDQIARICKIVRKTEGDRL